jgi:hypothetical protein
VRRHRQTAPDEGMARHSATASRGRVGRALGLRPSSGCGIVAVTLSVLRVAMVSFPASIRGVNIWEGGVAARRGLGFCIGGPPARGGEDGMQPRSGAAGTERTGGAGNGERGGGERPGAGERGPAWEASEIAGGAGRRAGGGSRLGCVAGRRGPDPYGRRLGVPVGGITVMSRHDRWIGERENIGGANTRGLESVEAGMIDIRIPAPDRGGYVRGCEALLCRLL